MSKSIGRVFGIGSSSPYGYETDYMQYLRGYNPYNYEQTLKNMMQGAVNVNVMPDYRLSVQNSTSKSEETADTFSEKPEDTAIREWRELKNLVDRLKQMNAYKEGVYSTDNGYEWNTNSYDVPQTQSNNIPQLKMPAGVVPQIQMPNNLQKYNNDFANFLSNTYDRVSDKYNNIKQEYFGTRNYQNRYRQACTPSNAVYNTISNYQISPNTKLVEQGNIASNYIMKKLLSKIPIAGFYVNGINATANAVNGAVNIYNALDEADCFK